MKRKLLNFILSFVLVALIAVTALTGCNGNTGDNNAPQTTPTQEVSQTTPSSSSKNIQDIGQGNTTFNFEVTDNNQTVTTWHVHTDETTVGAALLAVGLIKGDESEYGLYVKEVNGIKANYDTDKAYWAFYIDGEFATAGVDATNIEPEKTYAFIYTKE